MSRLTNRFVAAWRAAHPGRRVMVRYLAVDSVPHLDAERFAAFLAKPENCTTVQVEVLRYSDALIEELKTADVATLRGFDAPRPDNDDLDHEEPDHQADDAGKAVARDQRARDERREHRGSASDADHIAGTIVERGAPRELRELHRIPTESQHDADDSVQASHYPRLDDSR